MEYLSDNFRRAWDDFSWFMRRDLKQSMAVCLERLDYWAQSETEVAMLETLIDELEERYGRPPEGE